MKIGVAIYKIVTQPKSITDWVQALASAGIGGALVWFSERALWSNRVSQVSLALFESHVAEAGQALAEIPANASFEERQELRIRVWREFRVGFERNLAFRKSSE